MICIILIWIEYKDYFGWFLPLCAFAASWIFYGDVLVRLYGLVLRNLRLDNAKVLCDTVQLANLVVTTKRRAISDYHWFDRYNVYTFFSVVSSKFCSTNLQYCLS
ncbi:hypothetical protein AtEden1_Chr5g0153311 [Arabidopsis thaliana]